MLNKFCVNSLVSVIVMCRFVAWFLTCKIGIEYYKQFAVVICRHKQLQLQIYGVLNGVLCIL